MSMQEMVKCFTDLGTLTEKQRNFLAFVFWGEFFIGGHKGTPQTLLETFRTFAGLSEEEFWEMRFTHPMKDAIDINYKEFNELFNGQKLKDWADLFASLAEKEQGALVIVFVVATMAKKEGEDPINALNSEFDDVDDQDFIDLLDALKQHI